MELPFVLSIFHFLNIGHFSFARSRFSISTQAPPNKNPSAVHVSENDFLGSSYIPSPHLGIAEINYKFGSLQNTHDTSRSPEVLVAIACLSWKKQCSLPCSLALWGIYLALCDVLVRNTIKPGCGIIVARGGYAASFIACKWIARQLLPSLKFSCPYLPDSVLRGPPTGVLCGREKKGTWTSGDLGTPWHVLY